MSLEEKMDLMLGQMQELRADVSSVKQGQELLRADFQELSGRVGRLEDSVERLEDRVGRLEGSVEHLENRVEKLEDTVGLVQADISGLKIGQVQMRKELRTVSERVTVTYNLALDNWGQIVESKVRLNMLES